jgi:hypothetical protein
MLKALMIGLALAAVAVLALGVLRFSDSRADRALIAELGNAAERASPVFDPDMVDGLPDAAARFFLFTIIPGTPLRTTAVIEMSGELSLGTREVPNYQDMRAHQVLAPPFGFVWQVRLPGPMVVTGSDAYGTDGSWSRFRLFDLIPVGRVSEDPDHLRSSFGRMVGEGLFWSPAVFLPAADAGWDAITWEAVDDSTAAVTVRHNGLEQRAELTVDGSGQPVRVVFQRWSNENKEQVYRLQPFGGDLSGFQTFDGFRLPTRVVGGNFYGTDDYHSFFRAEVANISFQ